jgi:hypothetical protein
MHKIEKYPSMNFIFLEILKRPLLRWFSGGALSVRWSITLEPPGDVA